MSDLKNLVVDPAVTEDTARYLGLEDPSVVEKDIYVTHVIQQLTSIESEYFRLVFAGGTCLAKAHRVVQRSSEDVDFKLILKNAAEGMSTSAIRKHLHELRDRIIERIRALGYPLRDDQIRARNNGKYTYFTLDYPTHYSPAEGLRPHILIELNLSTLRTHTIKLPVRSLVDEVVNPTSVGKDVECISILEAAAEKWVALTRRIGAVERGHDRPDPSLIRHLYDLNAMVAIEKFGAQFAELVMHIMVQDKEQFKNQFIEYQQDPVRETQRSLSALITQPIYEQNYNEFVQTMVFSGKGASYDTALQSLQQLSTSVFDKLSEHKFIGKELTTVFSEATVPSAQQTNVKTRKRGQL